MSDLIQTVPPSRPRRGLRAALAAITRCEAACLGFGLAGMALALGVTVAQATLAPVILSTGELRGAAQARGGALCPDGWAADHAARLGQTEAEISAWYLREAMRLSDEVVVAAAGLHLSQPDPFGASHGRAATRTQILLCIAESRRMTQPVEELIPPDLREG